MICTKCNEEGIHNTANGKEFFYCRTCKEEIGLESPVTIDIFQDLPKKDKDEYEDWLKFLTMNHHAGDGDFYAQTLAEDAAYAEGWQQGIKTAIKPFISET